MDGNGRWAQNRGRNRSYGHQCGEKPVREVVETACHLNIGTLTLFAFSSDNWMRPSDEVTSLMHLFKSFLKLERWKCRSHGVRINVIGRRDRLGPSLREAVEAAERFTSGCRRMHLRIAVDYSARDSILEAVSLGRLGASPTRREFSSLLNLAIHSDPPAPDVDLLIRTGDTQRLSDFMLWECAYAEMIFVHGMWPDFRGRDLTKALEEFNQRERRFGRISCPPHKITGHRA
jgi:undecaprenyl diphosphate synthase